MAGGGGSSTSGTGSSAEQFANSPVFTGPDIVYAEALVPGDVIRIVRGRLHNRHPRRQDVIVMALRGVYFDHLSIATPSRDRPNYLEYAWRGVLGTEDMRRMGLQAWSNPDTEGEAWSVTHRALRLGLRLQDINLFTPGRATDELHLLNKLHGFEDVDLLEAQGEAEIPLEERVTRAFIQQAIDHQYDDHYQADLRGEQAFSTLL